MDAVSAGGRRRLYAAAGSSLVDLLRWYVVIGGIGAPLDALGYQVPNRLDRDGLPIAGLIAPTPARDVIAGMVDVVAFTPDAPLPGRTVLCPVAR